MSVPIEAEEGFEFEDSTFEINSPAVANDELIIELIFEMRALLQSGKGFGNILNLKELLGNFMGVVREKYGSINSTVLLRDDLDPGHNFSVRYCMAQVESGSFEI